MVLSAFWLSLSSGMVEDLGQISRNLGLSHPFSSARVCVCVCVLGRGCLLFQPCGQPSVLQLVQFPKEISRRQSYPSSQGLEEFPHPKATNPSRSLQRKAPVPTIRKPRTDIFHLSRSGEACWVYLGLLFFSLSPYLHSVRRWHILEHNLPLSFQESNCYFCVCER